MASSSQFLISMKFVGVDALSPQVKKITDQVKGLKTQVNSLGSGPSGGFKMFDAMSKSLDNVNKRLDSMQKKLKDMKSSGFGDILAGGSMVAPVIKALDSAGQMQTKMVTISGATGATPTDIKSIQDSIRSASNVTKFSSNEVADLAVKLATSGMTASQVGQLTPIMAKFAEVQQFGKNSTPQEAVTQAISAAHMLGIYDPTKLDSFLNDFNKATFLTPGSTSEFFDTFKYMSPIATGLGMSNQDILYTSALANRVGLLGSMGGTEAADMLIRSIPGIFGGQGHVDSKGRFKPSQQLKAMMDLGLAQADGSSVFFNNQGQFKGIQNFIDQLANASKTVNPEQLTKDFKSMFGLQGDKLAVLFSERGGEQLQLIQKQMENMKSFTDFQEWYNKTYEGQLSQLQTNIGNFSTAVGNVLLPQATHLINSLQGYAVSATDWVNTHKDEVKKIAEVTGAIGGFLLALGIAKVAIGTIGSLVIDPLKAGAKSLGMIFDSLKTKVPSSLAKEIPVQEIQANIVNVYGKSIAGGSAGGGGPTVVPNESKSKTIVDSKGNPIVSSTTSAVSEEVKKTGTWSKVLDATKKVAESMGTHVKGGVYAGATAGVIALASGQGVKNAAKDAGDVMGGWTGFAMGAQIGAYLGAAGGPIGVAVGSIMGGAGGAIAGAAFVNGLQNAISGWLSGNPLQQFNAELADRSQYSAREAHVLRKQADLSYEDNSSHTYNIQSSGPKEVADEVQSHWNGNMSKADWMRANSNN